MAVRAPSVFRVLYEGPGGIIITGVALVSLLVSAVALDRLGFAITLILLLLIVIAELWRAALRHESELGDLRLQARGSGAALDRAQRAEDKVKQLTVKVDELTAQANIPKSSYEGLLAAITVHLSVLATVEKHRSLRDRAPDARLTRARLEDDGTIRLTANCAQDPTIFIGESVAIVLADGKGHQVSGLAEPDEARQFDVFVTYDADSLPVALAEEIQRLGEVIPTGYSLRLAGLVDAFESISDEGVLALKQALEETRLKVHEALGGVRTRSAETNEALDSGVEEMPQID